MKQNTALTAVNFHENQTQVASFVPEQAINFETGRCRFVFRNIITRWWLERRIIWLGTVLRAFSTSFSHSLRIYMTVIFALSLSLRECKAAFEIYSSFAHSRVAAQWRSNSKHSCSPMRIAADVGTAMMCERAAAGKIKSQVPSPPPPSARSLPRVVRWRCFWFYRRCKYIHAMSSTWTAQIAVNNSLWKKHCANLAAQRLFLAACHSLSLSTVNLSQRFYAHAKPGRRDL